MPTRPSIAALPALLAATSLVAMPAQAAELPVQAAPAIAQTVAAAPAWAPGDDDAAKHRRYRDRRYRDRGTDVGDILTGLLIIGGIAAVASAVDKSDEREYPRDARYPDPRRDTDRADDVRGLDRAAAMCVEAIERDARVDTVDAVNRDASGWRVDGRMYDGQAFTCRIGPDGRIDGIDYGSGMASYDAGGAGSYGYQPATDRQYGADVYAAARARADGAQPAYPGGPLPGDDVIDGYLEYGTAYRGTGG